MFRKGQSRTTATSVAVVLAMAAGLVAVIARPAVAAPTPGVITSTGPLTKITTSPT